MDTPDQGGRVLIHDRHLHVPGAQWSASAPPPGLWATLTADGLLHSGQRRLYIHRGRKRDGSLQCGDTPRPQRRMLADCICPVEVRPHQSVHCRSKVRCEQCWRAFGTRPRSRYRCRYQGRAVTRRVHPSQLRCVNAQRREKAGVRQNINLVGQDPVDPVGRAFSPRWRRNSTIRLLLIFMRPSAGHVGRLDATSAAHGCALAACAVNGECPDYPFGSPSGVVRP
jgi:hypothetical protein